jgi:MoxR-like ATPase
VKVSEQTPGNSGPTPPEAQEQLEQALFEIRRVIAGQDEMLERVLVCLLAQGHLLIEGVPGLAKTLTIKTTAGVLGGTFARVQFTPDLVPSDLVGTRIYRPQEGTFDTELGPVFCNFLLADEINRAPAKVQSALLEVMQERQVTIVARRTACPIHFWSWRPRTRSRPRALTRCPKRRSTAS